MKGQTLIEALVALGVIAMVVTALAGIVMTSTGNVQFDKNKNLATQHAQEGMEIVRQKRDSNYVTFRELSGLYCMGESNIITQPSDCNNSVNIDNFFLRMIEITQSTCAGNSVSNLSNVTVTVSWKDGKCSSNTFCHTSRMESCFSTVNVVPTL